MRNYIAFFLILTPFLLFGQQTDTVAARKEKKLKDPRPRKATLMSTALPGLGQAFNKSYWKIPIIYLGEGVLIYLFSTNNRNYQDYRRAITYRTDKSSSTVDYQFEKVYSDSDTTEMRLLRDNYKRSRDFAIVGALLLYGLNIVDANVDAHLKSFKITNDLSFRIKPYYSPIDRRNFSTGVTLSFKFN